MATIQEPAVAQLRLLALRCLERRAIRLDEIDLKSAHRCHLWSRAIVQVKTTVMPAGDPTAAAGVDFAREDAEGLE